jgi:two-component system, cell cycle sensor histidine kinase and response regulator CckA
MDIYAGDLCPENRTPEKCATLVSLLSLLDRLPAIVWTADSQLKFTSLTGAGLSGAVAQARSFSGRPVNSLFGPSAAAAEGHRKSLQGMGSTFHAELNGRQIEAHVEPLYSPGGEVVGVIGVALDCTERLVAEALLRLSAQSYRSLIENAPYAMCRVTESGQLLQVNRAMLEMLGYSPDSEADLLVRDLPLIYDSSAGFETFRAGLRKGVVQGLDSTWTRADGSPVPVRVGGRATRDSEGRTIYIDVIAEDVTERRELELRLAQAQKMQAIGQLAGGVAHDFNNLLTVINGYCELLLGAQLPDSRQRESLELIRQAGERATNLTQQLLAFSRKQVTVKRPIQLNDVVAEVLQLSRRLIGENIALIEILRDTAGQVLADPAQIHQMLMNLVINARDAMADGGRMTVTTGGTSLEPEHARQLDIPPGEYVLLTVTDTGTGMEEGVLQHLFEPFFTTKPAGKGTGLGLSTAEGIVRQSGGSIEVDSVPGHGTTFRVYLPRFQAEHAPAAAAPQPGVPKRGASTILLVEDEAAVRKFAADVLASSGYAVLQAGDAEEALGIAERHSGPIHLLLTDIVMPGLNGRELATRFSVARSESRVLFASGYSEVLASDDKLDPATNFLAKPFSADQLTSMVQRILAK